LGWSGVDCSDVTCLHDCHNNGDCRNGTCICHPGFMGSQCELGPYQGDCLNNCSGHGHCMILDPLFDPHTIECHCDVGWDGYDCSIPSCIQRCSGNGACHADGTCQCYSGWTGDDCSNPSCPNDCSSQVKQVPFDHTASFSHCT
jgi:syndecan 4